MHFPGAHLHGCYFNFVQCLWRKVQGLGLSNDYKANVDIKAFIQKTTAFFHLYQYPLLGLHEMLLKQLCLKITSTRVL